MGSQVVVLNSNGILVGSQLYGPYGNQRYSSGTLPTSIGFTGQRADSVTGLDYYGARYYDPVTGVFLSPDSVQGNAQGMEPYAYVGGNPETLTDPTGQVAVQGPGGETTDQFHQHIQQDANALGSGHHLSFVQADLPPFLYTALFDPLAYAKLLSQDENDVRWETAVEAQALLSRGGVNWNANVAMMKLFLHINGLARPIALSMAGGLDAVNELSDGMFEALGHDGDLSGLPDDQPSDNNPAGKSDDHPSGGSSNTGDDQGTTGGDGGCSFTPTTVVQTDQGEKPIVSLKVGEQVLAYNPQTKKMEYKPIVHVWVHTDNDLVDLTLVTTIKNAQGKTIQQKEVIHTNKKHPFLTTEEGFVPVGQLHVGMHVLRADGHIGVITVWQVVPGIQMMYNLEVAQDHTFTVGDGQWVVHNCGGGISSTSKYNRTALGKTPSSASTNATLTNEPMCHWCGVNPSTVADHEPALAQRWAAGDFDSMSLADAQAAADDPAFMVGSCRSCNSSKAGRLVGTGPGEWDPRTSPPNRARGGPGGLPWSW